MFQIKHDQSPEISSRHTTSFQRLYDVYTTSATTRQYNFRQNRNFRTPSVNTVYHGSESISHLGPREIVPVKIKENNSLSSFKIEIRK